METEMNRWTEREGIRMDARLFDREMRIREVTSSWVNVTSGVPQSQS